MTESQFPHATQPNRPEEDTMSSKQPEVVTDENVEQQFLWLTNTAGNQLAELVGGVSSTSLLDQRAVDQLRSIAEVAGKLADRYEKDAVPVPEADRQHYGLVAQLEDDQKSEEDQKAAKKVREFQEKQSKENREASEELIKQHTPQQEPVKVEPVKASESKQDSK